MKKKNFLAVFIVLLTGMMVFTGCSQDSKDKEKDATAGESSENFNKEGYPIVDETISLQLMGKSSPIQPAWDEMPFFQVMNEKTNIDFEFKTASSDDFEQKKKLAFNTLELPDLFYGAELTSDEEVKFGQQGLLIPLEGLIDKYAPNLKKIMEKYPDIEPSITAPDGHIYALPGLDTQSTSKTPIMWLNGPWLDKLGAEIPSTTDEFYELLKQIKDTDLNGNGKADEIPLTANTPADLRVGILSNFGIVQEDGIYEEDGKVEYAFIQDEFKAYLKYLNKLYDEKLLDNEMFSHTWEQFVAKGERVGVYSTWPIVMVGFSDPAEALNYPILPPMTSPVNDELLTIGNSEIRRGRAAITRENEYPAATMRWLDYHYSEEGTILARLGIEGKSYEWNDDKTQWTLLSEGDLSTTQTNSQYAPGVGTNVPMVLSQELFGKEDNPTIHKISKNVEETLIPHAEIPYPSVYFTEEEQDVVSTLRPDIDSYFEQMEAKFITGGESIEEKWDEYVSTLKDMGIEDLIEVYQSAYDRWAEAK